MVGELVEPWLVSLSNHKSFQRIAQDLRFDKLNERLVQLRHNTTILTALVKSAVNNNQGKLL